jgi:ADP-ribosylglycohydrolase
LEAPGDAAAFQRRLARRLRWWLVGLPVAGGSATIRSICKLWFGVPPTRSGVWSAGNGPAMRSAVLGVYFAHDWEAQREFVRASSTITHSDPRAEIAAQAVADTAAWMLSASSDTGTFQATLSMNALLAALDSLSRIEPSGTEWPALVARLRSALAAKESVSEFASTIGAAEGVSGYAFQSVPVAIYAALRHRDDFAAAVTEVIACGGDTDTTGAITGALVGARVGVDGIPQAWRSRIAEWPRSLGLLERVADKLARQRDSDAALGPVRYAWPLLPLRNLILLLVVLAHGFRRLLPPY